MSKNIIVYTRISNKVLKRLEENYNVTFFKNYEYIDDVHFVEKLRNADGIIGLELKVTKQLLDLAPNLKIVSNISVGYDNLNLEELTNRSILATNTPGVLTDTTADAIFGILLATARRITELDQFVKQGEWQEYLQEGHFGVDVHHKTIGIIGMGEIGEAIAKRCHLGFNMNILYHNRTRKRDAEKKYKATYCELDELLIHSDFVCLMVPLSPETEKMIGEREFKLMKNDCIFINGSRGKNIDEHALYKALINKEIAAAGLDVFEEEPVDIENPLLKLNNVLTLPHIGSATIENQLRMSELAADNLAAGLRGECPPNLINKELIPRMF